ncbi:YadA C-terminal domain-containing protein [Actinobacillus delphinicola]|uniref:YadA domain-containing protein n=1 Tax=Actinobacillus delphinicola TaxID=51161 RepID=A0A448TV11_9PAST|nr:YadA C-terminal domain-containing protein [Actinobacillus delphinicola]VEJ09768.1 YadA domain-containing protein [Actinobacillus delphinicola]
MKCTLIKTTIAIVISMTVSGMSYAEQNQTASESQQNVSGNETLQTVKQKTAILKSLTKSAAEKSKRQEDLIKILKNKFSNYEQRFGHNEELLNKNYLGLMEHHNRINDNASYNSVNRGVIAQNTQAIKNNSRRIHNLDKREQRHMAQNAALAGLFQPYSIGRLNVTAAMGQYRSNNAIAFGAGYRFDNNLAVKAGFSMSTNAADDAAYNVGVNYEF